METIKQKAEALPTVYSISKGDLLTCITSINRDIEKNNKEENLLLDAIRNADNERKKLHREMCKVFECEFAASSWRSIENLRAFDSAAKLRKQELEALKESNPSKDARERATKTFRRLLERFFADKYVFDKQEFELKRYGKKMERGPHRTLSDGEKTVIAFCWFVACIHSKVKTDSDYSKIFLVFDDPVTSMSYDFIFLIAQTLKSLKISNQGEILISQANPDNNENKRPRLLILTHSGYFFSIASTSGIVYGNAVFSLYQENSVHKVKNLHKYVTLFEQQLLHVFNVSNGCEPDYSTGNAIRSVLETVGRFCRPDKSGQFKDFVAFLAEDEGIVASPL